MAITQNNSAKKQIIKILREQGYPTYAWLLEPFDIYLTDDPDVIGYMIPGQAKIVLNEALSIDQVSTIVRHEILHEYLSHGPRGEAWEKAHPDRMTNHDLSNIAADFEISNRGYTDTDKRNIRRIKMGDKILRGLVTEDEYPDWEDKTYEEMYDELTKEYQKDMQKMQQQLQPLIDAINKMDPQEIQDLKDQAQDQSQGDSEKNPQKKSNSEQEAEENSQQEKGEADPSKSPQNKGSGEKSSKDDQEAKNLQNQAQKASDQLDKIQDKLDDINQSQEGPFGDDKDQQTKADLAERIKEIARRLSDIQAKQQLLDETDAVVNKERVKAAKNREYRNITSGLSKFRMNFQRFIKDQVEYFRGDTWNRPNKNYAGSGFIMPGKTMYAPGKIPTINVYWDVSGSFSNPAKTQGAKDAIGTINQYVKRGDIKVNVFYFADRVASTASAAGGGTDGNAVLDHIENTKPTNVVVITDSDVDNAGSHKLVTVPGAVWMLFYDREANEFAQVLRGKSQTKEYLIEY